MNDAVSALMKRGLDDAKSIGRELEFLMECQADVAIQAPSATCEPDDLYEDILGTLLRSPFTTDEICSIAQMIGDTGPHELREMRKALSR
ncbi:MAG: hypothetical protein AAF732_20770 [Pseudomonadota bacterium]